MGDPSERRVAEAAAEVMSRCGARIVLEPAGRPSGPAKPVLRCRVTEAPAGAPSTVMVKYVPGSAGDGRLGLMNEWAALAFLARLGLDPPVSPTFYGGDVHEGVLVLEDLGDGANLADALLGSDAAAAEAALISLARSLGRMQAAGIERAGEHLELRAALGPAGGEAIIESSALPARFHAALGAAGLAVGEAADDVEAVIRRVSDPGPFLALVHGDACPSNERLVDGRTVLLDFATAGFRHALLDGVCGRVPFPTCWCARRLPAHVAPLMEAAYRSELIRACTAAKDDGAFASEAMTATAYWLIETTTVAVGSMPFSDFTWGTATIAQRLALRVALFAEAAEETASYGALAGLLTRLVDALGIADEEMPLYPAFGGPPV